ncbi:hypothetical protein SAMN05216371_8286 [Streptomyces sp. TLI_053]|nr:hypothetical protein SAMN05216371_8286 [Streptomyces sp. TLI_053]
MTIRYWVSHLRAYIGTYLEGTHRNSASLPSSE